MFVDLPARASRLARTVTTYGHDSEMVFTSGVFQRSQLDLTDSQLKTAVRLGTVRRIRNGWYASATADEDAVRACRFGGHITGPSLLKKYDVWLHADDRFHVRLNRHSGFTPPAGACIHYLDPPVTEVDEVLTALLAMAHCSPEEHLIAALDSVFGKRLLRREWVEPVAARHWKLRRALTLSSHQAQAGGETRLRLFFRAHRVRCREQVEISGVGRIDLLVGDRLVIEIDGKAHHLGDQFEADRRRDLELMRRGYLVIRLSYRQVFAEWEATQLVLLELIRDRVHRAPRRK